ncbi:hypothetical protein CSC70_09355 [Pseudoxanthomonas kalamensis DSM 18571]|uniref:sigma-E factor negative regulatory protein n=1 Tax=Pseudoxanthomonas kalamensis TaxID=289483 RepID=UPI0013917FCE|nr:sigma-E factor negative regulatory protein [Pseudoxanthomonas kalamensis]KAF1709890.1 hypothetical protein CSC70_09355 [Pseudoxanthomonas kalamensis DSM 18571]
MTMDRDEDKLELHCRRQLSALLDGDLSADEARFLLRRLQHDQDLHARWERWQLCGDVLRGQAQAPAPAGFAQRVSLAVAADVEVREVSVAADGSAIRTAAPRRQLLRWGGALAASVAAIALFMANRQLPQPTPAATPSPEFASAEAAPAEPVAVLPAAEILSEAPTESPAAAESVAGASADASAIAASALAVASLPRRQNGAGRGSATRTRQAARAASPVVEQAPALAAAGSMAPADDVIASTTGSAAEAFRPSLQPQTEPVLPSARPWPRSALSLDSAGEYTARYAGPGSITAPSFHPFEPHLPAAEAPPPPAEVGDTPSPQD